MLFSTQKGLSSENRANSRFSDGAQPVGGAKFDWSVFARSLWVVSGLFLDGWAHFNLAAALESFFTPWR